MVLAICQDIIYNAPTDPPPSPILLDIPSTTFALFLPALSLTLPTLACAWVLHQPTVSSVLLGATRPEQLDLPFAALEVSLDDATLQEIDGITRVFRQGDAVQ